MNTLNEEQERQCPHRLAVRRYLNATAHLPSPQEQCHALQREVMNICDGDLIQSLEKVLADAGFGPDQCAERLAKYAATYALLVRLRDLHQARLREAIAYLIPLGLR